MVDQLPSEILNLNIHDFLTNCQDSEFEHRYNLEMPIYDPNSLIIQYRQPAEVYDIQEEVKEAHSEAC